jgi:lipopolysaccharide transport system ATP-binding protein
MSSEVSDNAIISVENLGKKYRISHQHQGGMRYKTLRDAIVDKFKGAFSRRKSEIAGGKSEEDFWALKNVSFEVKRGDVVGIIGRNGAGKSTLLKILSHITEPTEGRVRIKGRVASLLEVGTGFHPELTGRENIFLNGAILGMSRVEIRKKFDEIVAFAEVEKFLDTPVKRYSSGMYVRLAFAVAAHLEPEILIVDEVLAVGDAAFQKKCLGKMEHVAAKYGRTVFFVSHNMAAMQMLCSRGIYLSKGSIVHAGEMDDCMKLYLEEGRRVASVWEPVAVGRTLELQRFSFGPECVRTSGDVSFELELFSQTEARVSDLAILIYSSSGLRVAVLDLRKQEQPYIIRAGTCVLRGQIHSVPLVQGEYHLGLYIKTEDYNENLLDLATLTVESGTHRNGAIPYAAQHRGFVELDFSLRH